MKKTMVKICGITNKEEIQWLNELLPEYMGMVLFFPKSKRNMDMEKVKGLLPLVSVQIKKVGVVVSPTLEQVNMIEEAGFDILQVHGTLSEDVLRGTKLPIIRAFNGSEMEQAKDYLSEEKIIGLLYDAKEPGSGVSFDWSMIPKFEAADKLCILSGGLNPENVRSAIDMVQPDLVDVSSGVEISKECVGKDHSKIIHFMEEVRRRL